MKLYTHFNLTKDEKGRKFIIYPDSESPKYKTHYLLVSDRLQLPEDLRAGVAVALGKVGKEKASYMIFPTDDYADKRVLLLFSFGRPGHRQAGYVDAGRSRFKAEGLLFTTHGSGAWGCGVAGAVVLNLGEWIVSSSLGVYKNEGGNLVTKSYDSAAQLEVDMGLCEDVEFV